MRTNHPRPNAPQKTKRKQTLQELPVFVIVPRNTARVASAYFSLLFPIFLYFYPYYSLFFLHLFGSLYFSIFFWLVSFSFHFLLATSFLIISHHHLSTFSFCYCFLSPLSISVLIFLDTFFHLIFIIQTDTN